MRDRADAQFLAGANHPQGNLAAVRNQDLLKHASVTSRAPHRYRAARLSALTVLLRSLASHARAHSHLQTQKWRDQRARSHLQTPHFFGRIDKQLLPIFDRLPVRTSASSQSSPATSDSISFINFMASTMQSTCPTSTLRLRTSRREANQARVTHRMSPRSANAPCAALPRARGARGGLWPGRQPASKLRRGPAPRAQGSSAAGSGNHRSAPRFTRTFTSPRSNSNSAMSFSIKNSMSSFSSF